MAESVNTRTSAQPIPSSAGPCGPLVAILQAIVIETMAYPPQRPSGTDSYLPPDLVADAQNALGLFGASVIPVQGSAA